MNANEIRAQNEKRLLEAQHQRAVISLATVQAENRRLRRLTANGRVGRILHRAAGDARQIVVWRWAGRSVSRRKATLDGLSRRRWMWAVALLERARVVMSDARNLDDAFLLTDFNEVMAEIDHAVVVLEQKGLESLIMRLPRNGSNRKRRAQ